MINPLNAKLNPICPLPALLGAHHILHVSRIRVKYNFSKWVNRHTYIKIDNIFDWNTGDIIRHVLIESNLRFIY
jgi:hypothetical protein